MNYLILTHSEGLAQSIQMIDYILEIGKDNIYNTVSHHIIKGTNDCSPGIIGQLSFKEEPAGKLRVFAMVDVMTQSLLKPLHDFLFSLFHKLPNDGTHDQDAAFQRAKDKSIKYNCAYGFDLSSATDRLPLIIQKEILNLLFPYSIGSPISSADRLSLYVLGSIPKELTNFNLGDL